MKLAEENHCEIQKNQSGRERGIRTPGGSHLNGFQDRRFQPLSHLPNLEKLKNYSVFSCTQVAPSLTFSLVHSPASLVSCLTPFQVFEHPEKIKIKAKKAKIYLIINSNSSFGGDTRIRTGGKGFAGPCLTTWPCRLI